MQMTSNNGQVGLSLRSLLFLLYFQLLSLQEAQCSRRSYSTVHTVLMKQIQFICHYVDNTVYLPSKKIFLFLVGTVLMSTFSGGQRYIFLPITIFLH